MDSFTPYSALGGGVLIGAAASLLLWLNGRIAGVSGIAGGLIVPQRGDVWWRLLFILGMVAGTALYYAAAGNVQTARLQFPDWLLASAGFLVGSGTSLGNGCTSGHGVCGLGLLSQRSLVATLVFLLTAIATAFVVRHVLGIY